jgi:predicted proteasome-type protease
MPDDTPFDETAGETEAGLDAIDTLNRVHDVVRRADESLLMLDSVPIAGTQGARHAMNATRLTVLERLLDDVRDAVGLEAPVPPGQMELGG